MPFQTVFKRYELKYLLTQAQKETVLKAMQPYMKLDKYGRTTIRNLYYDTDTYLLCNRFDRWLLCAPHTGRLCRQKSLWAESR